MSVIHFVKHLSLLPRATFRVFPAINLSFLSRADKGSQQTRDFQLFFIPLKGHIVKTHLIFLKVPFLTQEKYVNHICLNLFINDRYIIFKQQTTLSMGLPA